MTDQTTSPATADAGAERNEAPGAATGSTATIWLAALTLGLVACADWLFYKQPIGWTAGGFALVLLTAVAVVNRGQLRGPLAWAVLALAAGLCLAMIERPSPWAAGLFVVSLVTFLSLAPPGSRFGTLVWINRGLAASMQGAVRCAGDAEQIHAAIGHASDTVSVAGFMRVWLLPTACAVLFSLLFASANPVIGGWFSLDLSSSLYALPEGTRVFFWVSCAALAWWLWRTKVHPNAGQVLPAVPSAGGGEDLDQWLAWLFSAPAITRSMIIFNLLFAVQNALDAYYLWGHAALPPGFTFAAYAHRGAYPLMLTALLAGAFVLIAFRPGSESEHSRSVRIPMYLWVGQNIVLVASSIWRMVLYVEVYSLTHLRVAVLVWMGLVGIGLVLMIVRFAFARSNTWLVDANVAVLLAVLYAAAFANVGGFIAGYNVSHSRELDGRGASLDLAYIEAIGPSALPALRRYLEFTSANPGRPAHVLAPLVAARMEAEVERRTGDWRAWTFLLHRVARSGASTRS